MNIKYKNQASFVANHTGVNYKLLITRQTVLTTNSLYFDKELDLSTWVAKVVLIMPNLKHRK